MQNADFQIIFGKMSEKNGKDSPVPFEKVNARGKEKDRALSLTKKEGALSLTRITFFSKGS